MRLIFSLGDCFLQWKKISGLLLHLAENCHLLPRTLLKFGNAIGELDTKKIQAIRKLKNLTMVYKWRNIKGQVAHHRSQGTWGLEGDNGLGATSLKFKIHVPYHDSCWLCLCPSFDRNKWPFPICLPYVRRVVTGPNCTGTVPVWQTCLSM